MRTETLLQKIKTNPTLLNIVQKKKDITEQMNEDFQHRLHGGVNNFFTLYIEGEQGTQKSSVGQAIAIENEPTFKADQINFSYDEFLEKFKVSKPKTIFILDEEVFKHGSGSKRIVDNMQTIIETLRKRQNSIIIISPELKYFPENLFTYTLETFDNSILVTCPHNQDLHETRTCQCYMENTFTVKEAYVRCAVKKEGQYMGFYITQIKWNNPLWEEYSKKKDAFNELVTLQEHSKTNYEQMAEKIMRDPDSKEYRTKKALKILVYKHIPSLTVQEAEMVIEHLVMKRRIEEANGFGDEIL